MKSLYESLLSDPTNRIQTTTKWAHDMVICSQYVDEFHQMILEFLISKPSNNVNLDKMEIFDNINWDGSIYTAYAVPGKMQKTFKLIEKIFDKFIKNHENDGKLKYGELTYRLWNDEQVLLYRPLKDSGRDQLDQTPLYVVNYMSNRINQYDKQVNWPNNKNIHIIKKK